MLSQRYISIAMMLLQVFLTHLNCYIPQIAEMRADSHLQTYRSRLQISTLHYSSDVRTAAPSFLHSW